MDQTPRSCSSSIPLTPQPPSAPHAVLQTSQTSPAASSSEGVATKAGQRLDTGTLSCVVDSLGWAALHRLRHATRALNTFSRQREEQVLGGGRILYLSDAAEYFCYLHGWETNRELTADGIARLWARFDELRQASNSKPIVIVVDEHCNGGSWAANAIFDFSRHIRECGHPNVITIATHKYTHQAAVHILAAGKHRYAMRDGYAGMMNAAKDEEFEKQVDNLFASSTGDRITREYLHYLLMNTEGDYEKRIPPNAKLVEWGLIDEFINEELLHPINRGRTYGPANGRLSHHFAP